MKYLGLALALVVSLGAQARERTVVDCKENGVGIEDLMIPSSAAPRSFYNEQVWVYTVDRLEPACCSLGVAVVLPDAADPVGGAKCLAVLNLSGVNVSQARSSYDSVRGLLLEIPTSKYNPGNGSWSAGDPLKLRINLQSSSVTIE